MRRLLIPIAIALVATTTLHACNIPVFRYALERWRPDACEVVVAHTKELTQSQQQLLRKLESSSKNIEILHEKSGDDPGVTVRCKIANGRKVNVWNGPLDELPKLGLATSPARIELSKRLLKGDSVVWLMIASSDQSKNSAIKKRLQEQFDVLSKKIELPEGIGLPGSELFSDIPLLLQFSLLEIDPSDNKEAFLVKLLTGVQSEAYAEGEPLLVPVFGRGRALEVIPASDLTNNLLEDLTVFLSGACSCQVKERNPGFDLLLATDWNTELFGEDGEAPPDSPQLQQKNAKPILLTIPPGK